MEFTKGHGLGNDFIVINAINAPKRDYTSLAPKLCHRQTGVGADGLLIVWPSDACDVRMQIINSDGSGAEMCGNGLRVFAKYVYERGIVKKSVFTVETPAGVMKPALILHDGAVSAVQVDMGEPGLSCKDVPVAGLAPETRCVQQTLQALDRTFTFTSVRMGVPHTAVFVDDPPNFELTTYGPAIERHPLFPKRTNVNFIQVLDRNNVVQRTWERGCGPTLACGTGACATAVSCILSDQTDRKVRVHLALGTLDIEWAKDNHVFMTGPAALVFDSRIDEAAL